MSQKFGASPIIIGLLFMADSIVYGLASPIIGWLGDRYDKNVMMLIGMIMSAALLPVIALPDEMWLVFVAVCGLGVGLALLMNPTMPELAALVDQLGGGAYGQAYVCCPFICLMTLAHSLLHLGNLQFLLFSWDVGGTAVGRVSCGQHRLYVGHGRVRWLDIRLRTCPSHRSLAIFLRLVLLSTHQLEGHRADDLSLRDRGLSGRKTCWCFYESARESVYNWNISRGRGGCGVVLGLCARI